MAQQTAMQQLIKWMVEKSRVIPFDQEDCYDKAIELLQIEKEQIMKAYDDGVDYEISIYSTMGLLTAMDSEEYYNETYNK